MGDSNMDMGDHNDRISDGIEEFPLRTPIELAELASTSSTDPQPSTSRTQDGAGFVGTPPHQSPPPYPASGSGRSNARRRSRHRYRRMSALPPSQIGALAVKDESFCDCPQQSQTRDLVCKCGEEDAEFEWTWDKKSCSVASTLSDDTREVRFHSNYSSGTAAVKGSIPMTDRQHFWEIKMTTPVYGTDIMVGVGTGNVDVNAYRYNFCSLLGRDEQSWGFSYFGRTQHKGDFHYIDSGRFGQGSIIGVHLDMWHGAVSFYKNRRPLGVAHRGLCSKTLFPMVSSTAARTGMRLIRSCSFSTSLQFLCCKALRKIIPSHMDVAEALVLPPGLHAFLTNNLSWLLRPSVLDDAPESRKRKHDLVEYESDSDDDLERDVMLSKRTRTTSSESTDLVSDEESVEQDDHSLCFTDIEHSVETPEAAADDS